MKFKCLNCSFIFDWQSRSSMDMPRCPQCSSNAMDNKYCSCDDECQSGKFVMLAGGSGHSTEYVKEHVDRHLVKGLCPHCHKPLLK